jgi:outer membrane lipoprotein SlyB
MRGKQIKMVLVPLALAVGLSACESNGVAPGYVRGPSSASATSSSYGTPTGEVGRVVSINEVALRGGGGSSGGTGGMMTGGLIGAAGGSAIGAVASHTIGGALVGALLGGVGGAIAGNIMNNHTSMGSGGRGIEVTVQKDDGQTVRVAQRDEGDIQLGDRVQIVQDRNGTARAVHDNSRAPDYGPQNGGPQNGGPQNGGQQNNGPPPQDMQSSNNQRYVPRGPDYPPSGGTQYGGSQYDGSQYNGPQDQSGVPPAEYGQRYNQSRSAPRPQDDPRYGNLD